MPSLDSEPNVPEPESFLHKLGVTDLPSGLAAARRARQWIIDAGRYALGTEELQITTTIMLFCGLLARGQGFHEGAVDAIEAGNPYAAFTLLRSYAENAAAVLYLKDHPTRIDAFWNDINGRGITIGKMTNYANTRFGGFKGVYEQISRYAHPHLLSVITSHRTNDDNAFLWASDPTFHSDNDALAACGWAVELAEATSHLLVEFADTLILK